MSIKYFFIYLAFCTFYLFFIATCFIEWLKTTLLTPNSRGSRWALKTNIYIEWSFCINVSLICPQISSLHPLEEGAERSILRTLPKSLTWLSVGNISIFSRAAGICLEGHRRRGAGRRKISYGTTNKSPLKRTRCVRKDLLKILSLEEELLRTLFLLPTPCKPTLVRHTLFLLYSFCFLPCLRDFFYS